MKYFTKQWYENPPKELELPYSLEYIIANHEDENLNKELMDWEKESEERSKAHFEKTFKPYWEHYGQIEPCLPNSIKQIHNFNQGMRMHDCIITDSGFIGKDYFMDIDSSGGFCNVNKLTFVNAEILENDTWQNNETCWIYDEIYFYQDQKDRFEMHILFATPHYGLAEMIIAFDDILIDEKLAVED